MRFRAGPGALVAVALGAASPAARAEEDEGRRIAPPAREPPTESEMPSDTPGKVGRRVVAEALMGAGLGTVGFLIGPELTGAQCRRCLYASAFAGANIAFPLGVYWGGIMGDGQGSFWLTAVGPWAVAASGVATLALDSDYDGEPAFHIGVIGGAVAAPVSILVYELTNAFLRPDPARESAEWCPQVAVRPRGDGLSLSVGGRM